MYTVEQLKNNLLCGDSFDIMSNMQHNCIDTIITDIPYNVSKKCNTGNIQFQEREDMKLSFGDWDIGFPLETFLNMSRKLLKDNGNFVTFCGFKQFGPIFKWCDENFDRVNCVVWHKTNPMPQVRKTGFLSSVEFIVTAYNLPHTFNFKKQTEMHNFLVTYGEDLYHKLMPVAIQTPICMGNQRLKNEEGSTLHPTQKPISLMEYLVEVFSSQGQLVMDPFMGTGTTIKACIQSKRDFIGIEKDLDFHKAAKQRAIKSIREMYTKETAV